MKHLLTDICHSIGVTLFVWGTRLCGYNRITLYQPEGEPLIRAIHVAGTDADLNNSMRTYVEELDKTYERLGRDERSDWRY